MIHEADEIEPVKISISWIYFISRTKLGLQDKEVGRLTIKQFRELYQAYKDTFDLELSLFWSKSSYSELKKKAEASEEWFN